MEHTFQFVSPQELLQFSILTIRFEDLYLTMSKNVLCNLITNTGRTLTQKPLLSMVFTLNLIKTQLLNTQATSVCPVCLTICEKL